MGSDGNLYLKVGDKTELLVGSLDPGRLALVCDPVKFSNDPDVAFEEVTQGRSGGHTEDLAEAGVTPAPAYPSSEVRSGARFDVVDGDERWNSFSLKFDTRF